jgi:hypothetical protein
LAEQFKELEAQQEAQEVQQHLGEELVEENDDLIT